METDRKKLKKKKKKNRNKIITKKKYIKKNKRKKKSYIFIVLIILLIWAIFLFMFTRNKIFLSNIYKNINISKLYKKDKTFLILNVY